MQNAVRTIPDGFIQIACMWIDYEHILEWIIVSNQFCVVPRYNQYG